MSFLTRLVGRGGSAPTEPPPPSAQAQAAETQRLLEAGQITEAEAKVQNYLAVESEQTIDTSPPEVPPVLFKELLLFQNVGIAFECLAFALTTVLTIKYLLAGCFLVGCSMAGLATSAGWLSVPQVALPFISNPFVRWFIVTNHSTHITGLASILGLLIFLSYFSWFNSCRSESATIRATTVSATVSLSLGIAAFLAACYRNEKGNGGYIRWAMKLLGAGN